MKLAPGFFLVLSGLLFGPAQTFAADTTEIDSAIERGLNWVREHPANCQDDGFPDLLDEGLFYLTVRRLSAKWKPGLVSDLSLEDCLSRLEVAPEFAGSIGKPNKTLIEHYHLLLATHIIETVRHPLASRDSVIEQARRTLAESEHEHPTFRLTVGLLIRLLGADPGIGLERLLDAGLLNHLQQMGSPARQHPMTYYALVHEVATLTDFGRLPPSPWLVERRQRIAEVLQTGAAQAMRYHHMDLLAEIVLCHEMLDLPMQGAVESSVAHLLDNQYGDGTWGEQNTPRANRLRHAVQTATAALLAYRVQIPLN